MDVGDAVDESSRPQNIRVLSEQGDPIIANQTRNEQETRQNDASNQSLPSPCTNEMILCLCFLDLKCGSGNRKNSFLS